MYRPELWLDAPGRYAYRLDFRFVDPSGKLLRTKTWELRKQPQEEARVYTLQADAKWLGVPPLLQKLGRNFVAITAIVTDLDGPLHTSSLPAHQTANWHEQLAAFPISLGVALSADGLKFTLHIAKPKIS